jgi:hypothetical protein
LKNDHEQARRQDRREVKAEIIEPLPDVAGCGLLSLRQQARSSCARRTPRQGFEHLLLM